MQSTVLYTVSKKEENWQNHVNAFAWGAEAALKLQPNPTGNDPQRVIKVEYDNFVHIVHQRGRWTVDKNSNHVSNGIEAEFPDSTQLEVYDEVEVTLRVFLVTGATEDDCRKIADDVLNGKMNDRIDNIELVEFDPRIKLVGSRLGI